VKNWVEFMVEVQIIRIFLMDKVEVQLRKLLGDKYLAKIVSKYKHCQSHFDLRKILIGFLYFTETT
jgi:hypothetical protein